MKRWLSVLVPGLLVLSLPAVAAQLQVPGEIRRSESAERALTLLDDSKAWVLEWEGGLPEGWIQFDEPKAERFPLKILEKARKLVAKDKPLDPAQFSGRLVIALGRPTVAGGARPCKVGIEVIRTMDGDSRGVKEVATGSVRDYQTWHFIGSGKSYEVAIGAKVGQERPLFELRLLAQDKFQAKGAAGK